MPTKFVTLLVIQATAGVTSLLDTSLRGIKAWAPPPFFYNSKKNESPFYFCDVAGKPANRPVNNNNNDPERKGFPLPNFFFKPQPPPTSSLPSWANNNSRMTLNNNNDNNNRMNNYNDNNRMNYNNNNNRMGFNNNNNDRMSFNNNNDRMNYNNNDRMSYNNNNGYFPSRQGPQGDPNWGRQASSNQDYYNYQANSYDNSYAARGDARSFQNGGYNYGPNGGDYYGQPSTTTMMMPPAYGTSIMANPDGYFPGSIQTPTGRVNQDYYYGGINANNVMNNNGRSFPNTYGQPPIETVYGNPLMVNNNGYYNGNVDPMAGRVSNNSNVEKKKKKNGLSFPNPFAQPKVTPEPVRANKNQGFFSTKTETLPKPPPLVIPHSIWATAAPIFMEGTTLRTLSFRTNTIKRVGVFLKTDGRPLTADIELWQGEERAPQRLSIYMENGDQYPFSAVLETLRADNALAIRNRNPLEFPAQAWIEADVENAQGQSLAEFGSVFKQVVRSSSSFFKPLPQTCIRGGKMEKFPIAPNQASVQVLLKTDGRPLTARLELCQGSLTNVKQVIDIYTENGKERPFFAWIETPAPHTVLRVTNMSPAEYSLAATVVPYGEKNHYMALEVPTRAGVAAASNRRW